MEKIEDVAEGIEMVTDIAGFAGDMLDVGCTVGQCIAKYTHRQCSVHISNKCSEYDLRNPSVHTDTGRSVDPLPPTVGRSSSVEGLFTKTPCTARGSGGVFTYDLYNTTRKVYTGKVAVLYKVPFDLNLRSPVFGCGVIDMDAECNKQLFNDMYKKKKSTFVKGKANGPSLTYESDTVTIRATMSNSGDSVMKIEISDD